MSFESLRAPARELRAALEFLTICPLPPGPPSRSFGAPAFPAVGLALGFGAVGADGLLWLASPALRAVGIVAFWALATGALHYDALADMLDGLGGRTPEERLRHMKDSSIGAFGVLGLILAVAAKLAALEALSGDSRFRALILAPVLGRWAMVLTGFHAPAARADGLGATFSAKLEPGDLALATLMSGFAVLVAGHHGGIALAAALVLAFATRRLAVSRFGGITGDVLGASGEIVETVVLVVLAVEQGG